MARVTRLLPRSTGRAAPTARASEKPELGAAYDEWLEQTWPGDKRELREGRFLHQQADLRATFASSPYWREVATRLQSWSERYTKRTEALLFQGAPALPALADKPWQSFLSRTWRENVGNNVNWPNPPPGGWWLPDNWFERAWDIVRTRFVVRYMDGVPTLAEQLRACAEARPFKLEAHVDMEAKDSGYYAFHVYVRQPFTAEALDYDGKQERSSQVEIQVMTELAEVISELTHTYYEIRRVAGPAATPLLWDVESDEGAAAAISTQSLALERQVLQLRREIREKTSASTPPRRRTPRTPKRRRGT